MDKFTAFSGDDFNRLFWPYVLNSDPNFWVSCTFARMVALTMRTAWAVTTAVLRPFLGSAAAVGPFMGSLHRPLTTDLYLRYCDIFAAVFYMRSIHFGECILVTLFTCTRPHHQHPEPDTGLRQPHSGLSHTPSGPALSPAEAPVILTSKVVAFDLLF